jgi:hypothetical protein
VDDGSAEQLTRLEAAVEADAGAAGFPALAEAYRRDGRLADAEGVARAGLALEPESCEGRAVLALVMLDRGLEQSAREELEQLAASYLASQVVPDAPQAAEELSQAELDAAFDDAETDEEALIDPNRVAEEAIDRADAGAVGLVEESALSDVGPFATRTMAELLERQGDADGAARIRAALDDTSVAPDAQSESIESYDGSPSDDDAPKGVIIAVLERWLDNARRART